MFTLPKRTTSSPLGHSADISLLLHIADQTISLSQTSSNAVKLADDVPVPVGPARVEIITDGISHFSHVVIASRQPDSLWLNLV